MSIFCSRPQKPVFRCQKSTKIQYFNKKSSFYAKIDIFWTYDHRNLAKTFRKPAKMFQKLLKKLKKRFLSVENQKSRKSLFDFLVHTPKNRRYMPIFKEISTFLPLPFSTYFWKDSTEKRPIHTPKIAKTLQNCIKIGNKNNLSVLEQKLRKSYVEFLLQTPKSIIFLILAFVPFTINVSNVKTRF